MGGILLLPWIDLRMTCLVGMVGNDSVVVASDGLSYSFYRGAGSHHSTTSEDKIYEVGLMTVALCGDKIPDPKSLLALARLDMEKLQNRTIASGASNLAIYLTNGIQAIVKAHGETPARTQLLLAGFDHEPHLFVCQSDGQSGEADGQAWAGYCDTAAAIVQADHHNEMTATEMRDIAVRAIERAATDYPDHVGGNIFIHTLTKDGSSIEEVQTNRDIFHKLIKRASQPLPSTERKQPQSDGYSGKPARLHKAEDTSAKQSDESRPDSASTETKSPQ
jgi:20S proteasome alpha/beta subunit